VEWVFNQYSHADPVVLQTLGYEGWDDWRDQMMQHDHYGDELCLEAVAAVYKVRILLIFCGAGTPSHRFLGLEGHPVVYFGNVGDYHFLSFRPNAEQPKVGGKETRTKRVRVSQ
jgi:hypothetical protein